MSVYSARSTARQKKKASTQHRAMISTSVRLTTCVLLVSLVLVPVTVRAKPPAKDDEFTVQEDSIDNSLEVLANDVSPDSLTIVAVTQGDRDGTVDIIDDNTRVSYTPKRDFFGLEQFTYTVRDRRGKSGTARVFVSVRGINDPPIVRDDLAVTDEDTPVTIDILDNDTDSDGELDPSSVKRVGGPSHGNVVHIDTDTGEITYRPSNNWHGGDSFTYEACDDGTPLPAQCRRAQVSITIREVNDPPVADAGLNQEVQTLTMVALDGSGSNDPENDLPLSYHWQQTGGERVALSSATAVSPTFIAPGEPSVLIFDLHVIDARGKAALSPDRVRITVYQPPVFYAHMPLLSHKYVLAPDLIVERITASGNDIQVVIKNQGNAPVLSEFWVDGYINPQIVPNGVNQPWWDHGQEGMAWWVTGQALTALVPGGSFTLRAHDAYYVPDESEIKTWPLPAGTTLYAQVDSYNLDTSHGMVYETHERTGDAYNNIHGPVISTAAASAGAVPLKKSSGSVPPSSPPWRR